MRLVFSKQEKKGPQFQFPEWVWEPLEYFPNFPGRGSVLLKIQISSNSDALGGGWGLGICFQRVSQWVVLIKCRIHWAQLMFLTSFSLLIKEKSDDDDDDTVYRVSNI